MRTMECGWSTSLTMGLGLGWPPLVDTILTSL